MEGENKYIPKEEKNKNKLENNKLIVLPADVLKGELLESGLPGSITPDSDLIKNILEILNKKQTEVFYDKCYIEKANTPAGAFLDLVMYSSDQVEKTKKSKSSKLIDISVEAYDLNGAYIEGQSFSGNLEDWVK